MLDAKKLAKTNESRVLSRLAESGRQAAIATAMGVSDTTVSRMKTNDLSGICELLAHAGLKIVPVEQVSIEPEMYKAMTHITQKVMAQPDLMDRLLLGET